jgi:glyoxylase-like metal-dependent hydrolase (beta-lactamase superfamily II)
MAPDIRIFFDKETFTATYVVHDPATKKAAIIDSVLDFDAASGRTSTASADMIVAYVREKGLTVEWILDTHVHADHLTAAPYLKEKLGGRTAIGEHVPIIQKTFGELFNAEASFQRDGSQFDKLFADGESFFIGALEAKVMHTPGHTPACVTYVIGNAAFVGDTLFMPDYGAARCDFPGGDARALYRSIQKIFALPDKTRVFTCHDYKAEGRDHFAWESSIAEQKAKNIHIHAGVSEDEFVKMREARDKTLGMPKLILPAVQVNMRAGAFPPPEDNGVVYLKLPADRF